MKRIITIAAIGILFACGSFALPAEESENNNTAEVSRPARRRPEGDRKGRMNGEQGPGRRLSFDPKRAEELWKQLAEAKTTEEKLEIQKKYDLETIRRSFRRPGNAPGMRPRRERKQDSMERDE